jgi:uncharacterized membrane protein YccC
MRARAEGLWAEAMALARRMDWARGLRAGAALCVPLLLADVTGYAPLGWAALGGFEAIISDAGGPYRTRLTRLGLLSLGGAVGLSLGSVVGGDLRLALPVTLVFCFLWSYLGVLGSSFAASGILVQVIYICGLGAPEPNLRAAAVRGLLLLAGGLWAILISLVLWPFDPYRPARTAVSECYTTLASFLAGITQLYARDQVRPALWHRLANHHQRRLRKAVETAWEAVAAVRAETLAETAQSSYMVVLLESADMLLARSVALAEHLEATGAWLPGQTGKHSEKILQGLKELLAAEEWVADLLLKRVTTTRTEALARRAALTELPAGLRGSATDEFLLAQVTEGLLMAETSVEAAAALRLGEAKSLPLGARGAHVRKRLARLREGLRLANLRSHLRPDSLMLRHAVRVALVCSLDEIIVQTLKLDHGYWMLMTSLIVLQPYVSGTFRRGLERTVGTVAGGVFAALLAIAIHSPLATAIALFPLAVLCLVFLPINYAVFAFFLTPTFVLAYLPYPGDWQLAVIRVGDTVLGAVFALAAMRLLFPSFERERAGGYLLASLEANRRYLGALMESWETGHPASRQLAQARRATGLAHNATEESLDRLMDERWNRKGSGGEAALAVTTYMRRFAQSITTLTTLEGAEMWKASDSVLRQLQQIDARVAGLEQRLRCAEPAQPAGAVLVPVNLPLPEEGQASVAMGARLLARLERQGEVLTRQTLSLRQQQGIRCS